MPYGIPSYIMIYLVTIKTSTALNFLAPKKCCHVLSALYSSAVCLSPNYQQILVSLYYAQFTTRFQQAMERDSTISASVQDEAIMNHMSSIEAEVNAELTVGEIISLATLLPEYEHADLPGFIPGIKYLQSKYRGFRRIRRDGNCFYRGFLYKYLESLLTSFKEDIDGAQEELERFTSLIVASKEDLISIGFSEFSFDFFHEDFIELLGRLPTLTEAELFAEFQESSGGANSYTWYMRLLTSGKITS